MSRPLISCLLVTFNQEQWVGQALQSLLAQTYSPLEIVCSDDLSADRTYLMLQQMAASYRGPHRIVLRRNEVRRNVVGHLAEAAPFTSGELIVMAAGDDVSLPQRVSRLVEAWEASGRRAHALNSGLQQIDERGAPGISIPGCGGRHSYDLADFDGRPFTFLGAAGAYSRAVFERFGPLDPFNIFEDQVLPLRARLLGEAICVDDVLVQWRRLAQSNSLQFVERPARARARLAKLVYQQQQLACYLAQRIADIDFHLARDAALAGELAPIRARLAQHQAVAVAAATALQRPQPALALLAAAGKGRLSFKQALKLVSLHRAPGIADRWAALRMKR